MLFSQSISASLLRSCSTVALQSMQNKDSENESEQIYVIFASVSFEDGTLNESGAR